MIYFHIVSIFPEVVRAYCKASILGRAEEAKLINISYVDPRDYARNKWGKIDDRPYAGGPGMVMMADPLVHAIDSIIKKVSKRKKSKTKVVIFSPRGTQFTNIYAKKMVSKYTDIILIAGRYEGIDARVKKIFRAEEVSVGPFILTGGEVPAMVVVDACARQIKGVLGKDESREEERTASPEVYTRPEIYEWKSKKYKVPKILLSGDRKKIEEWKTRKGGKSNIIR